MKKYFLGFLALVFAIVFSSYVNISEQGKATLDHYYWFYVSDDEYAGSSDDPDIAPDGVCSGDGEGCIVGFYSDTPITEKPVGLPVAGTFNFD